MSCELWIFHVNEYFDSSSKIVESKQRNPEILPVPMVAKWCKTWLQKSEAFGQKCLISQPCFLLLSRASTASTASTLFSTFPGQHFSRIKEALRNCVFSWRFIAKVQSLEKDQWLIAASWYIVAAHCFILYIIYIYIYIYIQIFLYVC